jgi:hypothetical protein
MSSPHQFSGEVSSIVVATSDPQVKKIESLLCGIESPQSLRDFSLCLLSSKCLRDLRGTDRDSAIPASGRINARWNQIILGKKKDHTRSEGGTVSLTHSKAIMLRA